MKFHPGGGLGARPFAYGQNWSTGMSIRLEIASRLMAGMYSHAEISMRISIQEMAKWAFDAAEELIKIEFAEANIEIKKQETRTT